MSEIKIKEHDLHEIIKDLITDALGINRPNIFKICAFLQNLVENGGHKTKAARDAGYGPEKSKDGQKRTEENRNYIASAEGSRLLSNAKIGAVYERLLMHRIVAETFTRSLTKNHIVHMMYQIAVLPGNNPRQAISALKECATLAGYYDNKDASNNNNDEKELAVSSELIAAFQAIDEKRRKREEKIKNESYN